MIAEDIYKYYSEELTFYQLIIKKKPILNLIILLLFFASVILFSLSIVNDSICYSISAFSLFFLAMLSMIFSFKHTLKKYYPNIQRTWVGWMGSDIVQHQVTELHNFLSNKELTEEKKLERIAASIQGK